MSSERSCSSMRSSSRRPCASNRQSSTFSAFAENSAKLVPRPSQLAPRRDGVPAVRRIQSALGYEEDRSQRRNGEIKFVTIALQCFETAGVADIGAAIVGGVRIEYLAPPAAERHADAVVVGDVRREIHDDHATRTLGKSLAQPGEQIAIGVIRDQPLEACGLAIELVQRGRGAIELVEIADQRLHAGMVLLVQQVPVQRMIVVPFALLAEL